MTDKKPACIKQFAAKNRNGDDAIFLCELDRDHDGDLHAVPRLGKEGPEVPRTDG